MAGITVNGFDILTFDEIKAELEALFRSAYGNDIDLTDDSVAGQIVGIIALREATVWEVLQAIYNAMYPGSATKQSLSNVTSIVGVIRKVSTPTTMTLGITATAATVIPTGFLVSNGGKTYALDEGFTATGTDDTGDFSCTENGLFTPDEDNDPTIVNPISGVTSVEFIDESNIDVGSFEESDEELRLRRTASLSASGSSTVAAIRSAVAAITAVDSVSVIENDTEATVDGIPAKSFETIVIGGDTDDIAQAIFDNKPAGIRAFGVTGADVDGTAIGFTRPEELAVVVEITVTPIIGTYAGDDAVKEAIQDFINALGNGKDVVLNRVTKAALSVEGVFDVTAVAIAFDPDSPVAANLAVAIREIAKCALIDITLTTNTAVEDT